MRRLIVMRHAKSSWADPGQRDHDRPLNKRGRRGAALIGGWLASHGYLPASALVSTSVRTRETWDGVQAASQEAPTEFISAIYHAAPEVLLGIVRANGDAADPLLVLSHQPGVGAFAATLLAAPSSDPDLARYPTGATAVIDFDAEAWSEIGWGRGRLVDFVTPRTLE